MKTGTSFEVSRTSTGWKESKEITFNTLEDFLAFIQKQDAPVIINKPGMAIADGWHIEIYDDYRE